MRFYTAENFHRLKVKKRRENHGLRSTREYGVWAGMKSRCLNVNNISYKNYGGRGIGICEKWLNFFEFYKDIGEIPAGFDVDRIDNDYGYCKENCRIVTRKENNMNKRRRRGVMSKLGVTVIGVNKNIFTAMIQVEKIKIHIGCYKDEITAHNAYMDTYKEWYGIYPYSIQCR